MSLVAGSVVVLPSGSPPYYVEVFSPLSGPNLAREFYEGPGPAYNTGRKAALGLPNPAQPRGCQTTAPAFATAAVIDVANAAVGGGWSAALAYSPGDLLGEVDYIDGTIGADGQYHSKSVQVYVQSATATTITLTVALPSDGYGSAPLIPTGTQFGFQGLLTAWQQQVGSQLLKILQQLARSCTNDAIALVDHVTSNAQLLGNAVVGAGQGGLQLGTAAPGTAQDIALVGGIV